MIEGSFFSASKSTVVNYKHHSLISIDQNGMIDRVINEHQEDYDQVRKRADHAGRLIELQPDEYLLPGFIDLHVHAPQWPQAGLALDRPLNEWLNHYTFPLEARYQDSQFAQHVYEQLVPELLANGTTTALYFGTIHNSANLILAKAAVKFGQRAFIGKVAMDNPEQTPSYYRDESSQAALSQTDEFIQKMESLQQQTGGHITPVITPRFVPSCTDETLNGLGQIARKYDLPIQSHCSESNWEHQYVIDRFGQHDAQVLDKFGLLTQRSVMAHGTQLDDTDIDLFKQRGSAVAHCPISNAYFGNGVLPVNKLIVNHNKIGLGSDISGGYSPSLYENSRQAVQASRMLEDGTDTTLPASKRGASNRRISMKTSFYMATVGGADSLNIMAGKIEPGYVADLQIVQDKNADFAAEPADVLDRLMYQTSPATIKKVFVGGQLVTEK
ncbi:chlorohydrolase [Paucilactobacillus hokkaidonensis JCM 18461]|uniref:Guanine deaminase n=1 Tax=Paucilactobacillus hokkaidonensis JCM 18461 TaxID=1291742 RepID=A0A0A1GSL6_9LACO|nr:chlorohydrolase [Paucilactobacillus hokkaidonensis JCM 18461]